MTNQVNRIHYVSFNRSVLEQMVNMNPPRWYDVFIFWKKRKPKWKSVYDLEKEYSDLLSNLCEVPDFYKNKK